jgi:hypothetical protein
MNAGIRGGAESNFAPGERLKLTRRNEIRFLPAFLARLVP